MRIKGFLSIQFILGMSFFLIVLIFAIMTLVVYSLKYFDYINQREKYIDSAIFMRNLDLHLTPNGNFNRTFYKLIVECSNRGDIYDPRTGKFNEYYETLAKMLNNNLFLNFNIELKKHILLFTYERYNGTSYIGKYNGTDVVRIERSPLEGNYKYLYFKDRYYVIGDKITLNGEEYEVIYIDPKGRVAIISSTYGVCGPLAPRFERINSYTYYAFDNGILYGLRVYIW